MPLNENVPGKYIRKKSKSHFIELKPDGSYCLFEGATVVTGTYEVDGSEITVFVGDSTSRGKVQNGMIIDSEGDKWIRAKDASAISNDPLDSMSWMPAVLRRDDFPWELIDAAFILLIFIILMLSRA